MKLIHVGAHFHPHVGGVERHMLRVAECLAERGHEVTVVAGDHTGNLPQEELLGAVRVLRFPATRSLWRMRLWFLRRCRWFRSADAVHLHTPYGFGLLRWAGVPRRKRVYTAHGWGGKCPIPEEAKRLARQRADQSARLVCVGDFIDAWYGTHADMVTYGATEVVEVPGVSPRAGQVCLLGRLAQDTGVLVFADGLRLLAERTGEKMTVVVCGDGPLSDEVRRRLTHPAILLDMRGFVERPEWVVAESSVTLTSGFLGILEAMALGSAVLAVSDNPVKEDYLGLSPMAEWISIARTAEDVAAMLVERLHEPAESSRRQAGREFARNQTWEKVVEGYERLYRELG